MKHRLYVDEVGNNDLNASADPNHRYLSLTGVILGLDYVAQEVAPQLEQLKADFFPHHPDEPIILHRKELLNKKPPFAALRDPEAETRFNQRLLSLLSNWEYTAITVVIDKLQHMQRYQTWRFDPYHYGLAVMAERYALWLKRRYFRGDIMAESRGGKEDRRLKDSFRLAYEKGTNYITPEIMAECLTSKELKVKPKANNIAGLQIADMIAHASFKATLARKNNQAIPQNFGGLIARILEDSKYDRSPQGIIDGWGRKWLP